MVYRISTSAILPTFFYDKLSIYFLNKMESDEPIQNLKDEYDCSKDISGINRVLRKIFSFENYVWISNQTFK